MSRDFTNFMYGMSMIMTPLLVIVSCVLYAGGIIDTFTFWEGLILGLSYFKFGMKVYDYDYRNS